MKRFSFLLFVFLICGLAFCGHAQTPLKAIKEPDKVIKDTVIKSVTYKLYRGSKGGKYIFVTSKSGTVYKRYFK